MQKLLAGLLFLVSYNGLQASPLVVPTPYPVVSYEPPLTHAVRMGRLDRVAELLEDKQVDVNQQTTPLKLTVLMLACADGYPDIAKALLTAGANPDLCTTRGMSPMMHAARYGRTTIIEDIIHHGTTTVNNQNDEGWTALMFAVQGGHRETVRLLLAALADTSKKNNQQQNVFDIASAAGHADIGTLLMEHILEQVATTQPSLTPQQTLPFTFPEKYKNG